MSKRILMNYGQVENMAGDVKHQCGLIASIQDDIATIVRTTQPFMDGPSYVEFHGKASEISRQLGDLLVEMDGTQKFALNKSQEFWGKEMEALARFGSV